MIIKVLMKMMENEIMIILMKKNNSESCENNGSMTWS